MESGEKLSDAIRACRVQGRLGVIAEIKRRRFAGPDLLRGRSPAEIAGRYRSTGVTALSVVTSPWFGGRIGMLEEVAQADLGLPILRKDLIQTEKAIRSSRRAGASAVLLVLPLLGMRRLVAMLEAARDESIEPFVEVASQRDIDELRAVYHGLMAINNSDITVNEATGDGISRSLALIDRHDPRLWISASRISGAKDVYPLVAAGFDGILIGTHLLAADDLFDATTRIVAASRTGAPHA